MPAGLRSASCRFTADVGQACSTAEVWAYGSRVSGGSHQGSDLDLVFRQPSHLTQDVPGWLELVEALQGSPLPLLVQVHQWSRLPDVFHRNIEADYVVQSPRRGQVP